MATFTRTQEIEHEIGERGRLTLRVTDPDVEMRAGEVFDMDIVTYAGSISGWVIGAVNRNAVALTQCSFAGDFDQMCRVRR